MCPCVTLDERMWSHVRGSCLTEKPGGKYLLLLVYTEYFWDIMQTKNSVYAGHMERGEWQTEPEDLILKGTLCALFTNKHKWWQRAVLKHKYHWGIYNEPLLVSSLSKERGLYLPLFDFFKVKVRRICCKCNAAPPSGLFCQTVQPLCPLLLLNESQLSAEKNIDLSSAKTSSASVALSYLPFINSVLLNPTKKPRNSISAFFLR